MKCFSLQARFSKAILFSLVLFFSSLVHSIDIHDITNLADDSDFPVELFESYDPRDIARTLVTRARRDTPIGTEPANVAIKLYFPEESIENVIHHGFYNYWLTHTTGGYFHEGRRRRVENSFLRLNFNAECTFQQFMLPKYAGINPFFNYRDYGSVVAVMKNDVKQRATWSWDDSMYANAENSAANIFESNSLKQPNIWRVEWITMPGRAPFPRAIGPHEAHIWGPVDLSDVDHIILPKSSNINQARKFKDTGVRILQEIELFGPMTLPNSTQAQKEIAPENHKKRILFKAKMDDFYKTKGFNVNADR